MSVNTCISYWEVRNAAGLLHTFQRKPFETDRAIANLYRFIPDIDDILWKTGTTLRPFGVPMGARRLDLDPALEATTNAIYNTLLLLAPTDAQKAELNTNVQAVVAACTTANRITYIKVDRDNFLKAFPAGQSF